eukprot:TRINITY_DN27029_c0_g1_i1.p1 TRINITY_DN27029_c0_g1~~TRINITY_DN27029_c0_g1_i1.p1  ORF type:complete len:197 (-),score=14.55 TRINITY_DN27029_c0_g1_i1:131-721(-)
MSHRMFWVVNSKNDRCFNEFKSGKKRKRNDEASLWMQSEHGMTFIQHTNNDGSLSQLEEKQTRYHWVNSSSHSFPSTLDRARDNSRKGVTVFHQEPVSKLAAKKRMKRNNVNEPPQKCAHCSVTDTPEWRVGPLGKNTLCNACGLQFSKNKREQRTGAGKLSFILNQTQAQPDGPDEDTSSLTRSSRRVSAYSVHP